jgi:hypothetical protein
MRAARSSSRCELRRSKATKLLQVRDVAAASRPVRRILFGPRSAVTIHLGRRSPDGSSGLPGVVGRAVLPLLGLAPGGACRATRVTPGAGALLPHRFTLTCAPVARRHRRSALCCAVLRVAPTGGYPAPCPVESGRSSNQSSWSAATRPTRCTDQCTTPRKLATAWRWRRPTGRPASRPACRGRRRSRGARGSGPVAGRGSGR